MNKYISTCKKACSEECPSKDNSVFKRYCDASKYSNIGNNNPSDRLTTSELKALDNTCGKCNEYKMESK